MCWHFFCNRRLLGYRCSVLLPHCCQTLRCRFGLFLFRLLNLNHFAGLKLIRKIRGSRLLSLRWVHTGQRNADAHNRENRPQCAHRAKSPPPLGNVNLRIRNTTIMTVPSSTHPAHSVSRLESLIEVVGKIPDFALSCLNLF